jgi:hypothetical protein
MCSFWGSYQTSFEAKTALVGMAFKDKPEKDKIIILLAFERPFRAQLML